MSYPSQAEGLGNYDITALRQPARQLWYVVYLCNFMIAQEIVNSYDYKLQCVRFARFIYFTRNCMFGDKPL